MNSVKFKLLSVLFFSVIMSMTAQEITVFPGMWNIEYYQDDKEITKKELKQLFAKNQEVQAYWKKSNTFSSLAYTAVAVEVGFGVWTLAELNNEDSSSSLAPAIGTVGFGILAVIFLNSANKNAKKAILTYNKQFDNKTTFRLSPISNNDGLGIAIKW